MPALRPGNEVAKVTAVAATPVVLVASPPAPEIIRLVRSVPVAFTGAGTVVFTVQIRRGGNTYILNQLSLGAGAASTAGEGLPAGIAVLLEGDQIEVVSDGTGAGTGDASAHYADEIREEPRQ